MDNKEKIKYFQSKVAKTVDFVYEDLIYPEIFIEATKNKENIRTQFDKLEYKKFNEDWIVNIESFFPSLNQIIRNLRNTLKYEEEILPTERTRRTNSQSIRHLLRNTRYIREINDDAEIVPSRILNTISEIDYGIYENRFIMTLIDRLYYYLLNRLDIIKQNIHGYKQTNFKLKNKFKINNAHYTLDFELNAQEDFDSTEIDSHNKRVYERTNEAFKIVSRMFHSDFMRTMTRYQKVKPPILKTQIILKNPDFRNAYMLWLFLDRLNALDYTLEQRIEKKAFKEQYLDQIDKSLMMLFSTIFINSDLDLSVYDERNIKLESIRPTEEEIKQYSNNLDVIVPKMIIEPNLATEYHLELLQQEFGNKYAETLKVAKNNKESLKQVILDQYSIADQIFNSYLNLDQDDDVFSQLITINDPLRMYEDAFEKYNITKASRQVKEELYLNSIILEDRWIKELLHLAKRATEDIKNNERKINDDILRKLTLDFNKEIAELEQVETEQTKHIIQNQRVDNNQRIKELKSKFSQELSEFRAKENQRLNDEKRSLREQTTAYKNKIREQNKSLRKEELEKLKNNYNKTEETLTIKQQEQKEKITADISKKINVLREEMTKDLPLNERVIQLHEKVTRAKEKDRNSFNNLNVNELKTLARNMELKGYSKLNKNELIKFIFDNSDLSKLSLDELNNLALKINEKQ